MQWNFGDILLTTLAIFVWAALIWMFIARVRRHLSAAGSVRACEGGMGLPDRHPAIRRLPHLPDRAAAVGGAVRRSRGGGERTDFTYTRLDAADEIEKAGKLQAAGAITPEEFATIQEQALARAAGG